MSNTDFFAWIGRVVVAALIVLTVLGVSFNVVDWLRGKQE